MEILDVGVGLEVVGVFRAVAPKGWEASIHMVKG